jgi:glutathione S-transferase
MKLYNLKAGLNPRRVRIFLAEKGIAVPMVDIDLEKRENRAPAFLALNPLGTLPVLELDDGTVLTESTAICRYFEALHPAPPLFGTDPLDRALVEMWMRRVEFELMLPVTSAFIHTSPFWAGRRPQVPAYGEVARETAFTNMAWFDRELANRSYIAGESYTVADIAAQCTLVLAKQTGTRMPEGLENLARWFATVTARPTARA